jgi:predicted AAA+ superfamily ATPase
MEYLKRFADKELTRCLSNAGAVLVAGPKACGKTETAAKIAACVVRLDTDAQARLAMSVEPARVLQGDRPCLLDEWQEFPELWNLVRREVDDTRSDGQFILTSSISPDEKTCRHSGAGRFSVMRMRPMSFFECGWSSGETRLSDLFAGKTPSSANTVVPLEELAEKIIFGGWPGLFGKDLVRAIHFSRDYTALTAEVDISRVSGKRRNPGQVERLLQSLARNLATEATLTSLADDVRGADSAFKDETVADYLDALDQIFFCENLPAWRTHIRSSATLRQHPKRHFADPSLACGILRLNTAKKLLADMNYFGLLFESLVIRDLRIYAQANDAKVFHYHDSAGREVDAIVEAANGDWLAIEVELDVAAADTAAKNLLAFAGNIETAKTAAPRALVVITANGFAHTRPDGVRVVPLATLTA